MQDKNTLLFLQDCIEVRAQLVSIEKREGHDMSEQINMVNWILAEAQKKGVNKGLYYYLADVEYEMEQIA
jgi:hypothetical protein